MILRGWPNEKQHVPEVILPYFSFRDELGVHKDIILRGEQIVIPVFFTRINEEESAYRTFMYKLLYSSC